MSRSPWNEKQHTTLWKICASGLLLDLEAEHIYRFSHIYWFLNTVTDLMFIGPCIIVIVEEQKTNFMSLAILFHFLCAQHVSDINMPIIRNLRLFCWITTLVILFLVRCMFKFRYGWVVVELQPATRIPLQPNHTETPTHIEPRTIRPMW